MEGGAHRGVVVEGEMARKSDGGAAAAVMADGGERRHAASSGRLRPGELSRREPVPWGIHSRARHGPRVPTEATARRVLKMMATVDGVLTATKTCSATATQGKERLVLGVWRKQVVWAFRSRACSASEVTRTATGRASRTGHGGPSEKLKQTGKKI